MIENQIWIKFYKIAEYLGQKYLIPGK